VDQNRHYLSPAAGAIMIRGKLEVEVRASRYPSLTLKENKDCKK